jgi:hypothetical protein
MTLADTQAYNNTARITAIKSFEVQAPDAKPMSKYLLHTKPWQCMLLLSLPPSLSLSLSAHVCKCILRSLWRNFFINLMEYIKNIATPRCYQAGPNVIKRFLSVIY